MVILIEVHGYFKERLSGSVRVLKSLSDLLGSKRMEGCKPMPKKIEVKRNESCIGNHVMYAYLFSFGWYCCFCLVYSSDASF